MAREAADTLLAVQVPKLPGLLRDGEPRAR
jgi:hypothetical protein